MPKYKMKSVNKITVEHLHGWKRRIRNMSKVDGYQAYTNSYADSRVNRKRDDAKKTEQKHRTEDAGKSEQKKVHLSEKAKALLEELKKKYGNMDFFVADYSSDEEAQSYLSRGTKQYSVLIEPDLLEEMASDENTKQKYLGIIDNATTQIDTMKDQLGDDAENVKKLGFSVQKDGTVSYFAVLEQAAGKQRERIEEAREEKRVQEKKDKKQEETKAKKEKWEERLAEKAETDYFWNNADVKRTTVHAGSIDELIEKIRAVDWNLVKGQNWEEANRKFDFRA